MRLRLSLALVVVLIGPPLLAANGPDLSVSIIPPAPTRVYQPARYTVRVTNTSNSKNAAVVSVVIQLPVTLTSP